MLKKIKMNQFVYVVGEDIEEYEIREMVEYCIDSYDNYLVLKLDDGTLISVDTNGHVEELCDNPRVFYLSYKEAKEAALKSLDEDIEYYSQFSQDLKRLVERRKKLLEE